MKLFLKDFFYSSKYKERKKEMVFQHIDPFYFIVAFAFGVFLSYIFTPKPQIVIKYPTPQNAGTITYIDDGGVCYRYEAIKTDCPDDKSKIKTLPIQ